jgi:hypothetical protein
MEIGRSAGRVGLVGLVAVATFGLWNRLVVDTLTLGPVEMDAMVARSIALESEARAQRHAEGHHAGFLAARFGQFSVYEYGLPGPGYEPYRERLWEQYAVRVHNLGCVPLTDQWDWQVGFSEAVRAELMAKYGRDIFKESWNEAIRDGGQ